ncbi:AI-2E family transporter [Paraburkholderia flagellata]|uniref:AI-2E family transporter n=1 Tax=Paraburkholderia flagellata TaxID=2883241 RepID=UPI001F1FC0D9|nr:AI-2E family transporter [Paraburkholderia flagellata]
MAANQPRTASAKVAPADSPNVRQLTSLITAVVVVGALDIGREVLIPITLAVLLSFLLAPLVELLRRIRLGRVPSVVIAVAIALAAMGGTGSLIGAQVAQLAGELPQYQVAIEQKIERVQEATIGRADELLGRASKLLNRGVPPREGSAARTSGLPKPFDGAPTPVAIQKSPTSSISLVPQFLSSVASPVVTAGIVLVVTIFVLLQREDLRDRLIRLFGSRDLHRTTTAMDEAASRLSRYFLAQFGVNLGVGLVVALGLVIIGVPGAVLFGVLTALLRFVPYVGTWIGALLALSLAATGPDWSMLLWTVALFGVTDLVASQVIEPVLYGHHSGLSPVAVIVAAIFWSWIWGPLGLVLSTPLTLCLVILGRHVEKLAFFEVLLGDRPPLAASANFYQRILADDPDEALKQAEQLMAEMSLVDYYDTVMLEGLQLAHADMMRGVILPEQLGRIKEALADLIDEFEDIDEAVNPSLAAHVNQPVSRMPAMHPESPTTTASFGIQTSRDANVLCIAGRGGLDDIVAIATIQLLGREGIPARQSTYAQFSRQRSEEVDLSATTAILVVSLDARESTAYLRVLLRRLHQRAPEATLVLGFTSDTAQDTSEQRAGVAMAASSFRQLITLARAGWASHAPVEADPATAGRLSPDLI